MIAVSTHTDVKGWSGLDEAAYAERKAWLEERLYEAVRQVWPAIGGWVLQRFSGSPRTYERYTSRPGGRVGGYPAIYPLALWRAPSRRTRLPGLTLAGDTTYPGQGMGTALSGILAWQAVRSGAAQIGTLRKGL